MKKVVDKRAVGLFFTLLFIGLSVLLAVACQPVGIDSPRVATQTAQIVATPTNKPTPFLSEAPTATPSIATQISGNDIITSSHNILTLWVNETSTEHKEILDQMAADFNAQTGIQLEVVLVNPDLMPGLVNTAVISKTLPDLILHEAEFSPGWAQAGILNLEATNTALEDLGRETFNQALLDMLTIDQNSNQITAIPSDGWQQVIVYRSDWFQDLGLAPPDNFDRLQAAAEAIFDPENNITGLVVPTDSKLVSTQRVFEHLAIANGCRLIDGTGKITLLHPACLEALEYYRVLVNTYSPIGFQTDTSALNAYLAGRTGMIIASPLVLPILAGLNEHLRSSCPECTSADYLAQNSGILTSLEGNGEFAESTNYPALSALAITNTANAEMAKQFIDYWFNDGYIRWLSVNPEYKVPLRSGTPNEPEKFIDEWLELALRTDSPTLKEIYGSDVVDLLARNLAPNNRWGFPEYQGELISQLYENLTLSPLLQEMLSGYLTSSQTVVEMYSAAIDLIPDYAFPIEIAPTPTPE